MISPPNTLDSVVRELRQGLQHGTIVLPQELDAVEVSLSARQFENSAIGIAPLLAAQKDFSRQLELQRKVAAQDRFLSLLSAGMGFVSLVIATAFTSSGRLSSSVVPMAGGIVICFVSALFGRQAYRAQERIKTSLREEGELVQLGILLELSSSFKDPEERNQSRHAIFEAFLDRIGKDHSQNPKRTNIKAESAPKK